MKCAKIGCKQRAISYSNYCSEHQPDSEVYETRVRKGKCFSKKATGKKAARKKTTGKRAARKIK